jgi:IS30 family transposase
LNRILSSITSIAIKKFFEQNNIWRFEVLKEIIVDNTKQFDNDLFKELYSQIGIKVAFASVYHPQSNRAIERANALIFEAIKKCLDGEKKGK